MQKFIEKMSGFKATNKDMTCNGHAFELGKWYEHKGEVKLCESGFHFCIHPSGPLCYYTAMDCRVFKCEAEQILECPTAAGADFKLVAKRMRLVEEITPGMNGNDSSNTGNWNTGNSNTGNSNTGNWNTGDWNTGNWNTGNSNTGNRNTGDSNTGNRNTGDRNTGDRNTGDSNTGNRNTGNWNTGDWNTTNFATGFFCQVDVKVVSFDKQTKLTREQFFNKYPEVYDLGNKLREADEINFEKFKRIPGITRAKLKTLHAKHLAAKKGTQ